MPKTCPNCGFEIASAKGEGMARGARITRLNGVRLLVLKTVDLMGCRDVQTGMPSRVVSRKVNTARLASQKPLLTEHQVGAALSALCGAGLTSVDYTDVEVTDESTQEVRFVRKPVWWVTADGRKFLSTGELPHWPPNDPRVGTLIPKEYQGPGSPPESSPSAQAPQEPTTSRMTGTRPSDWI